MPFQIDGNNPVSQQELQLQAIETFFLEVIDYEADGNGRNDVMTKNVAALPAQPIQLRVVQTQADVAEIAAVAQQIVFQRTAFVLGQQQQVVGFR